jgi:hypothetical protein
MSAPVMENSPEPGSISQDRPELGVLFVGGFADQRPGTAIAEFGGAVYRWLFRWDARLPKESASPPALSDTVLSGASAAGDDPAHVTLGVPAYLGTEKPKPQWLLAESSWADLFAPARFLGVARWIWKVSTCLLVLQFVIPMHRHWNQAVHAKDMHAQDMLTKESRRRRLADLAMALCYVGLMAVAAMVSVLLSLVLLALAVAEKLPIPRIDDAVRWIAVRVSTVLGDSYMLAHCPVQFAAMRTRVAHDLRWLQGRCDQVAVVAHSQGAAIAHQVLKDLGGDTGNVQAFITFGQGIGKFRLLYRLDWDRDAYHAAWCSRVLVTTGMFLAGLPALSFLLRHWINVKALVSMPAVALLPGAGFVIILIGVHTAMHAVCGDLKKDLVLPEAKFRWSDYYASADPVSNGPLVDRSDQAPGHEQASTAKTDLIPDPCYQVYNSASILFDHNRYLRNQDQLVSQLINDLAAAAYGGSPLDPRVVCKGDLIEVGHSRHRLALWLVAARILTAGLAVGLWWANLGSFLKGSMNRLVDLFSYHAAMGNGLARFVASVVFAAVVYVVVIIVWRIRERYVIRRFFHPVTHADANVLQCPQEPPAQVVQEQVSVPVA